MANNQRKQPLPHHILSQSSTNAITSFDMLAKSIDDNKSVESEMFVHVTQIVKEAKCINDLLEILYTINPLEQLKQLLLTEINQINTLQTQHNHNNNNSLSINKLYFRISAFDNIFSDAIICNIIPYLSSSNMYNKLPIINKHFNSIMRNNSCLFSHYTMKLPLITISTNKLVNLHVCISHKFNIIELYPSQHKLLLSKINKKDNNTLQFKISNLQDMNKNIPFIWNTIHKYHFIQIEKEPVPQLKSYIINIKQWGGNVLNELMKTQIPNIHIIKIELNKQTPQLQQNQYKDISSFPDLKQLIYIDIASSILATKLFTHKLLLNILYFDIIRIDDTTNKILKLLRNILVLKIKFSDNFTLSSGSNLTIDQDPKYRIVIPPNVEFIEIIGFQFFSSEYVLNFMNCSSLIGVSFKHSTFELWMTTLCDALDDTIIVQTITNHIIWPINNNNIQCVLLDEASNDHEGVWWRYFKSFQLQNKSNGPQVKYLRYLSSPRLTHDNVDNILNGNTNDIQTRGNRTGSVYDNDNTSPILHLNKSLPTKQPSVDDDHDGDNKKKRNVFPDFTNKTVSFYDNIDIINKKVKLVNDKSNKINANLSHIITPNHSNNHTDLDWDNNSNNSSSFTPQVNSNKLSNILIPSCNPVGNINKEYSISSTSNYVNPFTTLSPKAYTFPLYKHRLLNLNKIGENDDHNFKILSDENNDGLLWKLLLLNKYKNKNDKYINNKLNIYKNWFNMNVCKWVYHFGTIISQNNESKNNSLRSSRRPSIQSSVHPIDLQNYMETYYDVNY